MKTQETSIKGFGRVLKIRRMGKIVFINCIFKEENLQFVFKIDDTENFEHVGSISIGDLLYVIGTKGVTRSGEKSLFISRLIEIKKNDSPITIGEIQIPNNRFRNRHIDLGLNIGSFEFWKKYSSVISLLRNTLLRHSFHEFNTGILQYTRDAGLASAFITECKANKKLYALSLTAELKLKRLIAGGFSNVYEITQSFRNEGMNKDHIPEFTLLEAYAAELTSSDVTTLLEELVRLSIENFGSEEMKELFMKDFQTITFTEVWNDLVGGCDISLPNLCKRYPALFKPGMPEFTWIYKFICKLIAPRFVTGTFVKGVPHGFSPFAAKLANDDRFMDGGILIINQTHLATYSADSNDYNTVRNTLEKQSAECGVSLNSEFLEVLKFGLPPTAGFGMGINRLMMLFLDKLPKNARETCLYPLT